MHTDRIIKWTAGGFCVLAVLPFLLLAGKLIAKGWEQFSPNLFTQAAPDSVDVLMAQIEGANISGGILNGIYGSILSMILAAVPAIPLGILAGMYIHENRSGKPAAVVYYINSILHGMPSIVVGVLVYLWVVRLSNHQTDWAAGMALALILGPKIVNVTVRTLEKLPAGLKESGIALGGSKAHVLFKIVLPAARKRLSAGILTAVSKVLGTTAPLLIIAMKAGPFHWNTMDSVHTLPLLIWHFFHHPVLTELMWSAALFLFIMIVLLNSAAKFIHPPYD
jgi:phosphate transport system permease protein